jgi:hypothetical protein
MTSTPAAVGTAPGLEDHHVDRPEVKAAQAVPSGTNQTDDTQSAHTRRGPRMQFSRSGGRAAVGMIACPNNHVERLSDHLEQ